MGSPKFKALVVCIDNVPRNRSASLELRVDAATNGPSI